MSDVLNQILAVADLRQRLRLAAHAGDHDRARNLLWLATGQALALPPAVFALVDREIAREADRLIPRYRADCTTCGLCCAPRGPIRMTINMPPSDAAALNTAHPGAAVQIVRRDFPRGVH